MKSTRQQALRIAQRLGSFGAHQDDNGNWLPCEDNATMIAVMKGKTHSDGAVVRKSLIEQRFALAKSASQILFDNREDALSAGKENECSAVRTIIIGGKKKFAPCKGKPERLAERGVSGIDTLPDGSLISAKDDEIEPIDAKGFVNYVSRSTDPDVYTDPDSARVRARQLGCIGIRSYTARDGKTVYLPCTNGSDYNRTMNLRPDGRPKKKSMPRNLIGKPLRPKKTTGTGTGSDGDGDGMTTGPDGRDNVPAPPKMNHPVMLDVPNRPSHARTEQIPGEGRMVRGFDADPEDPAPKPDWVMRRIANARPQAADKPDEQRELTPREMEHRRAAELRQQEAWKKRQEEQRRAREVHERRRKLDDEIRSAQSRIVNNTEELRLWSGTARAAGYEEEVKKNREKLQELLKERDELTKLDEKSLAKTPAPKKDKIFGSRKNRVGSAGSLRSAGDISMTQETVQSLIKKVREHNASVKKKNKQDWAKTNLRALKAVYRRGAGAFSTSHRPGMTRNQWAMGRVNAFLALLMSGEAKSTYTTDNDLLPKGHPWKEKGLAGKSMFIDDVEYFAEEHTTSVKSINDKVFSVTRFIAFPLPKECE